MSIFDYTSQFIEKERSRFQNYDNNVFSMSFSQIIRYRKFLSIISTRYQKLSKSFIVLTKEYMDLTKKLGSGPVTEEMATMMNMSGNISDELHLEIESFYQFSKILLDRIASFLKVYFGETPGISLLSHNKLQSNINEFKLKHSLKLNEEFISLLSELKNKIVDYRDDHIVHKSSPRDMYGTMWSGDGKIKISKNRIYPKETDRQNNSENLDELLVKIDMYIKSLIILILDNQNKTALKLERG